MLIIAMDFTPKDRYGINDLLELMKILRSEEGCPWDREQTHKSIRGNMLEEAGEAVEAIDLEDMPLLQEELGDVLLQVVFHARISEENGGFDFGGVVNGICKKLVDRHSHVFGGVTAATPEEALENWNREKRRLKAMESDD